MGQLLRTAGVATDEAAGHATSELQLSTDTEDPMAFHPYLFFSGTCRQAFTRYQEIFGGELVLLPMSEMPSDDPLPAEQADLIMHAALSFEGDLLMGSDDPSGDGGPM